MSEDIQQQADQSVNTGDVVESTTQEQAAKTYTQEDVNGLVAKEAKKAQEKIFKSLGFEDIKSAKEGLDRLKEWQDSQKSETQKQAEALTSAQAELDKALADNKALTAKLAALSQGVVAESVDDVIALADRLVTDEVSIEDAIGQVLGKYPQFGQSAPVEKEKAPTFTVGGNPSATNQPTETDPFAAVLRAYKK